MQPYDLLDHTADAKFRAYGATREEAFANAVKGVVAIVTPPEALGTDAIYHISVRASKLDSLLFDFLDEVLFLYDTEKFLPSCAEALTIVEREGKFVLDATLRGEAPTKISGNLKAVTYSDMICAAQPDGTWLVQVVIDIWSISFLLAKKIISPASLPGSMEFENNFQIPEIVRTAFIQRRILSSLSEPARDAVKERLEQIVNAYEGQDLNALSVLGYAAQRGRLDEFLDRLEKHYKENLIYVHPEARRVACVPGAVRAEEFFMDCYRILCISPRID